MSSQSRQETAAETYEAEQANGKYVFNALGCCFTGCDFDNIMLCSKGDMECLCFTHEHCLAANHDSLGIGLLKTNDDGLCKLGMFCCSCGCKMPQVLCKGVTQFLCCVQAQAFPLDKEVIGEPLCTVCCYTCKPEPMGCAKPYPDSPALNWILECTTPASEVITRDWVQ